MRVLDSFPEYDVAREQLALVYQQTGRFDQAIALFQEGCKLNPSRQGVYVINIAILNKLANRSAVAQGELETFVPTIGATRDPELLIAWWYLGELYREHVRREDAIQAYENYLRSTESLSDQQSSQIRDFAAQNLRDLKRKADEGEKEKAAHKPPWLRGSHQQRFSRRQC